MKIQFPTKHPDIVTKNGAWIACVWVSNIGTTWVYMAGTPEDPSTAINRIQSYYPGARVAGYKWVEPKGE